MVVSHVVSERYELLRQLETDRSEGWEDRRKAYMRVRRGWAMDIWQAQPWQEDGHLHVGNAEWLLSAYAHFHWELPAALIPRRHCPGDSPATARTSL